MNRTIITQIYQSERLILLSESYLLERKKTLEQKVNELNSKVEDVINKYMIFLRKKNFKKQIKNQIRYSRKVEDFGNHLKDLFKISFHKYEMLISELTAQIDKTSKFLSNVKSDHYKLVLAYFYFKFGDVSKLWDSKFKELLVFELKNLNKKQSWIKFFNTTDTMVIESKSVLDEFQNIFKSRDYKIYAPMN